MSSTNADVTTNTITISATALMVPATATTRETRAITIYAYDADGVPNEAEGRQIYARLNEVQLAEYNGLPDGQAKSAYLAGVRRERKKWVCLLNTVERICYERFHCLAINLVLASLL